MCILKSVAIWRLPAFVSLVGFHAALHGLASTHSVIVEADKTIDI